MPLFSAARRTLPEGGAELTGKLLMWTVGLEAVTSGWGETSVPR